MKKSKKAWNNPPTGPVTAPSKFKDILALTAIALDRGLISENDLHEFINSRLNS